MSMRILDHWEKKNFFIFHTRNRITNDRRCLPMLADNIWRKSFGFIYLFFWFDLVDVSLELSNIEKSNQKWFNIFLYIHSGLDLSPRIETNLCPLFCIGFKFKNFQAFFSWFVPICSYWNYLKKIHSSVLVWHFSIIIITNIQCCSAR